MNATAPIAPPTLEEIRCAAKALEGRIVRTPCVELSSSRIKSLLPPDASAVLKLELFQNAGSFKARGALLSVDALSDLQREQGVTGISAGNHALAIAWACAREDVSAKVVMPQYADPVRIKGCRELGAEIVLMSDIHAGFDEMDRIVAEEGRIAIHPFEGVCLTLGTATCGLELVNDYPDLDAIVVPVGGGGLIGGIGTVAKLINPKIEIIGVEPTGADVLFRSLEKGETQSIEKVDTIADSLGSPRTLPYSFSVAQRVVDQVVCIEDREMLKAMAVLYDARKISPEPACAAATAAMLGPLRTHLAGKRVGVIACGSNIGEDKFSSFLQQARESA
ncbi:MAG: pyridoxal-phosphate dependent enzyme [Pseudomonadota bacterium]